ncbi:unnamed protein product [Nezara viridula]|uniref:Odorant receptor n=1 Tax=Nezara viridula TaxID=85310 RepID=A0A9P0E5H6_NEZVI|nr:unnamed protein product [Nezara viridula]
MWQHREDPEANVLVDAYVAKHYYYILIISGLYPKMDKRNRILSTFQLMMYVIILVHQMVIILKSTITIYGFSMVLFSQNVHLWLLMQVALIVLASCVWKNLSMFLVHRLLANDFYDYQEPAANGEDILRSKMKTERRRLALIPIGVAVAAGVVLIVTPIVDLRVGSFDFNSTAHIFDYHFPLPYTKYPYYVEDGFGFCFAFFGQVACGLLMSAIIAGGGFLFINMSENVCLQLMILNNSLDNIESRIEHLYSKLFGKMDEDRMDSLRHDNRYAYCFTKCLRKNFEHHQVILKAFHLLEDISSLPVGSSYMTGTIVIALSLISAGSNTELRSKIYNTRWYMCSKEVKRTLMIFQEKTLKPMIMTAGKVVPANMETFTTVGGTGN